MSEEIIFYIKKGRKYIPHSTYSQEFCDGFTHGAHLVMAYPGGASRKYNIDPAYAPMIAAGRVAEESIAKAISDLSSLQPKSMPITEEQRKAWQNFIEVMGPEARILNRISAMDIAQGAVKVMAKEADKLMTNPAVKKAYERFLLVCELTKEHGESK